jgi:hypothetical protein
LTTFPHERKERRGHEPSDAPPRGVAIAAAGLIIGILLSLALVGGLFSLFVQFGGPSGRVTPEAARQTPPEPRLEISPQSDRMAIETAARLRLSGYGWADRQAARARIPIDRAMDMLAGRGWPDANGGNLP